MPCILSGLPRQQCSATNKQDDSTNLADPADSGGLVKEALVKRSITSIVAAISALLNVCFARADPNPQLEDQQVIVRLYNLADVPARILDEATRHAALVLATAGVMAVWQQGAIDAKEAHTVDLSSRQAQKTQNSGFWKHLVLIVVGDAPAGYLPGALGRALPESQIGVNAMIFYDRVERLKQTDDMDLTTVLGLAMAHEIGHVLLRSSAHSQGGIMKSPWTKTDLQHAAARLSKFTESEREAVRLCPWLTRAE